MCLGQVWFHFFTFISLLGNTWCLKKQESETKPSLLQLKHFKFFFPFKHFDVPAEHWSDVWSRSQPFFQISSKYFFYSKLIILIMLSTAASGLQIKSVSLMRSCCHTLFTQYSFKLLNYMLGYSIIGRSSYRQSL